MMQSSSVPPLVTVIIPTYNRSKLVREAIDSVLAQDFKNYELIVVDDGSTDGTEDVLEACYGEKINYIWQENQGESAARNKGLAIAKGSYIAFLDSDDLWLPEKLSRQVPALENNAQAAVVFCQAWHVDIDGKKLEDQPLGVRTKSSDFNVENLLMFNKIPAGASTCLIRRSVLDQVGGFAEDIRYGDEWDLWLRIAGDALMIFIPEPLASYRRHKKTQSYFPDIKDVDGALFDHINMLTRCQKRNPEKISKHSYDRAIAHQYFRAGLSSFLLKEKEKGSKRLSKAVECYPSLWRRKQDFAEQVSMFAITYALNQDSELSLDLCVSFVDLLCENLPKPLNQKRRIRLTKGRVRVDVGFLKYRNCDFQGAFRQILSGILIAPELIDLAILAVLAEPLIGRNAVDQIRSIRHRNDVRAPSGNSYEI